MKLISQPKYFFYPDLFGNLKLPEDERLAVEIIRPKAGDRGKVSSTQIERSIDGKNFISRMVFDTDTILRRHVGQIKNLEVEVQLENGKEEIKKITTGEELAASTFYGCGKLIDLIVAEAGSDTITEAEKKIGKRESSSSPKDGTIESGTNGQGEPLSPSAEEH